MLEPDTTTSEVILDVYRYFRVFIRLGFYSDEKEFLICLSWRGNAIALTCT